MKGPDPYDNLILVQKCSPHSALSTGRLRVVGTIPRADGVDHFWVTRLKSGLPLFSLGRCLQCTATLNPKAPGHCIGGFG